MDFFGNFSASSNTDMSPLTWRTGYPLRVCLHSRVPKVNSNVQHHATYSTVFTKGIIKYSDRIILKTKNSLYLERLEH